MFRVKICGITMLEDALAAVDAGADAIGLNFFEGSSRCVTIEQAASIRRGILDRWIKGKEFEDAVLHIVGVFVNSTAPVIQNVDESVGLNSIQLHGDETVGTCVETRAELTASRAAMMEIWEEKAQSSLLGRSVLAGMRKSYPKMARSVGLIRARRFDDRGVAAIAEDLAALTTADCQPFAILVDAATPGRYGGTGETVSWVGLADHKRWLGDVPLILAGGLTPENVAEAIRIVRPAAVDVASGVEFSPGKKDPAKIRDFVAAATAAFAAISPSSKPNLRGLAPPNLGGQ